MFPPYIELGEHLLGRSLPPEVGSQHGPADATSAAGALRLCLADSLAMLRLRRLLDDELSAQSIANMDDPAMLAFVAELVGVGRLWLVHGRAPEVAPARAVGGSSDAEPERPRQRPDERAARAAPPRAAAGAGTRAAPAEEDSFGADLDGVALAATLQEAAESGVPFCEECARARQAA